MSLIKPIFAAPTEKAGVWSGRCAVNDVATMQGFECLFANVLQYITFFAGIVFFFMFIVGGYKYMFAGGDQKKVAAANATLTTSIIGLVGLISSVLLLNILQKFIGTGVNILDFVVPGGK